MSGYASKLTVSLTDDDRAELERWLRCNNYPQGMCRRARIILLRAADMPIQTIATTIGVRRETGRKWIKRFREDGLDGLNDRPRSGRPPVFPPVVAMELVRIACEMPERLGRSLCLWDCAELAIMLQVRRVIDSISPQMVQRILYSNNLKPWRFHPWLRPKARDQEFIDRTRDICQLYTEPLPDDEIVLCVDEKTSLQPRTRLAATKPAQPGRPVLVEHEYKRKGALNLFAAFNISNGQVIGDTYSRKRQREFIDFLQQIETATDSHITTIHIVCDNLKVHSGKQVIEWLKDHPRFCFHFTPVHCSWMNQVEQWFGILQRKRFTIANFESIQDLAERIAQFIAQWNEHAKPFKWTKHSFDKVLQKATCELNKAA